MLQRDWMERGGSVVPSRWIMKKDVKPILFRWKYGKALPNSLDQFNGIKTIDYHSCYQGRGH